MNRLWVAYNKADHSNPFGRKMIGYAGWHNTPAEALKEAIKRYPEVAPEHIEVS